MEQSFVNAKYEYEYLSGNGQPAKMYPGDVFTLLRKSNTDWWYVKREGEEKPVYLPATYLEIQPDNALLGRPGAKQPLERSVNLIPRTKFVEPSQETFPSGNPTASPTRNNNLVSEMANRFQHRVTIPAPDYEEGQEKTTSYQHQKRPSQLNVKDSNGRQGGSGVTTPIGGTASPMTDSEPSSHSEPSSITSPDFYSPPSHDFHQHSHYANLNPISPVPTTQDEWETHTDKRGRKYYYKPSTNETSWDPPPKRRSPSVSPKTPKKNAGTETSKQGLPPGWREERTANGNGVFINSQFKEKWYKSQNDQGKTYYYSGDREETGWNLPTFTGFDSQILLCRGVDLEISIPMNIRRHSEIDAGDVHPETASSEREGVLQYVRIGETSRKVKWLTAFAVMNGSALAFYKDQKLRAGTADMRIDLWGAEVTFNNEKQSKHSKRNYIELHADKHYWLQGDSDEETQLWYTVLHNAVRSMPAAAQHPMRRQNSLDGAYSPSNNGPSLRPTSPRPPKQENLIEIARSKTDKKKIKNKLKSFIIRRPPIESLQKQGIMKEENVFGRHIQALCKQQGTQVPRFVSDCIALIDSCGLEVDGIYRVSGNLSLIQKLRFMVDQEKKVDFNSSPWKEDIHVIAGALKLYFRELPEPLLTFDGYDKYIMAMKIPDHKSKLRAFQEVTSSLPRIHVETMKVLFRHLDRVVQNKDKNRMLAQNLAIVFGPTLMWPRKESFNVALSMVYQNQCIEFIINEHMQLFR
ncbi:rho GTPase-activating protein 15-like isoform X2 [Asterias rubens]|uniref:rho GTPase-activating protein 15-like isoform X2 n=1 Tax=Asterias rubens TaxID=7604 RepID=UPI001454FF62|nr:rho GTPase-activating protein 15-like isoform X2 [Asterias rubens]